MDQKIIVAALQLENTAFEEMFEETLGLAIAAGYEVVNTCIQKEELLIHPLILEKEN